MRRATAEAALADRHYVSPIDIMMGIGWLSQTSVLDWRRGRIPYLEQIVQANLNRVSNAMSILRRWAKERGLKPSETAYLARTRGPKRELRFSKSGRPGVPLQGVRRKTRGVAFPHVLCILEINDPRIRLTGGWAQMRMPVCAAHSRSLRERSARSPGAENRNSKEGDMKATTVLIRTAVLLLVFSLGLSSCSFQVPRSHVVQYVGVYGFSQPEYSACGINLFLVGLHLRLGGVVGLGVYGTPVHVSSGYGRWIPHIHIAILPFVRTKVGIVLAIISVGIG